MNYDRNSMNEPLLKKEEYFDDVKIKINDLIEKQKKFKNFVDNKRRGTTRNELLSLKEQIIEGMKQLNYYFKDNELKNSDKSSKLQYEKLMLQYKKLSSELLELIQKYSEQEKQTVQVMSMTLQIDNPIERTSQMEELSNIELFDVDIGDIDEKILEERKEELKQIETDLEDVASMFSDINKLIVQQGQQIDHIDSNVENVKDNVDEGTYDSEVAAYLDCKRRCCCIWCCIFCCVKDPREKNKK
eukprot:TRINITY_DN7443_c0_g1_i1.p1 TRINITY_DN7443_c0_g1~~TRINITY_DN7443_c0_g1_i1.p1  ORF type:complete len:244 (-),score=81.35 TRINITY_DN7443_c0_g1_i1:59-790(-)